MGGGGLNREGGLNSKPDCQRGGGLIIEGGLIGGGLIELLR